MHEAVPHGPLQTTVPNLSNDKEFNVYKGFYGTSDSHARCIQFSMGRGSKTNVSSSTESSHGYYVLLLFFQMEHTQVSRLLIAAQVDSHS